MKTVSIGLTRADGDFAILSTFNNNDGHMSDKEFEYVVHAAYDILSMAAGNYELEIRERQDAPDYVST